MGRAGVAGVDDDGDACGRAHEAGDAARVGAVGMQRDLIVAGAALPKESTDVVQQGEVSQPGTSAGPCGREEALSEPLGLFGAHHPRPRHHDVGDGAIVGPVKGEDVVDPGVSDDAACGHQVDDRWHGQPRLMRAMGWMFISGLSSW